MPAQTTTKPSLFAKYGKELAAAFDAHKGDDTTLSNFGDLPAGIDNGIAQLKDCKFDVYKEGEMAGEMFFYAAGVVCLPTEFEGAPVEGMRTSIMEAVCPTPTRTRKTIEQHTAWILNQFRLLGINTANMTVQHLEPTAAALMKAQPYFRFRTWKGKPQVTGPYAGQEPRTNHTWLGLVDYNPEANATAGTADNTVARPSASVAMATNGTAAKAKSKAAPAPVEQPQEAPAFDDGAEDLDALGRAADEGDKEASIKLTELADQHGCSDEVKDADSWSQAVEMIREAMGVTSSGSEEAAAPATNGLAEGEIPQKDEVWAYDSKGDGSPTNHVVVAVNVKKRTVNLKVLKGKTVYENVSWDDLIQA